MIILLIVVGLMFNNEYPHIHFEILLRLVTVE